MISRPPTISVCIPTYNRSALLQQAIESVLAQTSQDFELVICDDASTDDTEVQVRKISDPRLKYFRLPAKVSIAEVRNALLSESRGQYVAWLDSDDLYFPQMLELQAAKLDERPEIGMVHGAFDVIDEVGGTLPPWPRPFPGDMIESGHDAFAELLLANYVQAPTVMVRREAYNRVGGYSEALGNFGEDWEMWLRISLRYDVAYTATAVAAYRWHAASATGDASRRGRESRAERGVVRRVFQHNRELIPARTENRRRAGAALAARAILRAGDAVLRGDARAARQEWSYATRAQPSLATSPLGVRLAGAIAAADEPAFYKESTALLRRLVERLAGTRFGESLRRRIERDPAWDRQLREIAAIVRCCTPADGRIALVDKWDPTLRALCERRGWHFPDLKLHPAGYPADSGAAIAHLGQLIDLGAAYLVIPSAAFWWLDHYGDFRRHLDDRHRRIWDGEQCVVFALSPSQGPQR